MTTYETPRDAEGRRLCEHCQKKPVPASLGTKKRRYCSRNCVQRAYEARKTREAIVTSVAVAVARDRKSRELAADAQGKSRDVPKPQVTPPIPAPVAPPTPPPADPAPTPRVDSPPRPRSHFASWASEAQAFVSAAMSGQQGSLFDEDQKDEPDDGRRR